jgi:hypothetical protein
MMPVSQPIPNRAVEPARQLVAALLPLSNAVVWESKRPAPSELIEAMPNRVQAVLQRSRHANCRLPKTLAHFLLVGHDQLARLARRQRPAVGDEIGDR